MIETRGFAFFTFAVCWSCSLSIPLSHFYLFGPDLDSSIGPTDDGSSDEVTGIHFPFNNNSFTALFVNNNGIISLNRVHRQFNPHLFPLRLPLIAPFWADVDTSRNGTVWFGLRNNNFNQTNKAKQDIIKYFCLKEFEPNFVFVATWYKVSHFNRGLKTNTFQCILISDGTQSYTIFLYADGLIEWTTGDASRGTNGLGGNAAHVGYNAGDGESFENVPGSGTASIINITRTSNVGINGVWAFQLNEATSRCSKGTWFQLILRIPLGSCSTWIGSEYREKIVNLQNEILRQLTLHCNCNLVDDIISNDTLLCFPSFSTLSTYRAVIQGNMAIPTMTLLSYIEESLTPGIQLQVNGEHLEVLSEYQLSTTSEHELDIESETSGNQIEKYTSDSQMNDTSQPTSNSLKNSRNALLIIAISVSLAILLLIVTVIILLVAIAAKSIFKWKRRASLNTLTHNVTTMPAACFSEYGKASSESSYSHDDHLYEAVIMPGVRNTSVIQHEEFSFTQCDAYGVPNQIINVNKY